MRLPLTLIGCACLMANEAAKAERNLPANQRVVLESTKPLRSPRGGRLALYVLPITGSLAGLEDARAETVLRELDDRGIGYTVDWSPGHHETSLAEGLRVGAMQQRLGLDVSVNANACLYSFFDGSDRTLHVDDSGQRFAETSFAIRSIDRGILGPSRSVGADADDAGVVNEERPVSGDAWFCRVKPKRPPQSLRINTVDLEELFQVKLRLQRRLGGGFAAFRILELAFFHFRQLEQVERVGAI